jgi:hypothetical protein
MGSRISASGFYTGEQFYSLQRLKDATSCLFFFNLTPCIRLLVQICLSSCGFLVCCFMQVQTAMTTNASTKKTCTQPHTYMESLFKAKSNVFLDVTPFILVEVCRRFGGTYCLHIQSLNVSPESRLLVAAWFLLGSTFFRNGRMLLSVYMASHPRWLNASSSSP